MNDDNAHDRMPDWYDPFDEPRTLPSGWDLSGLAGGAANAAPDSAPPSPPGRPRRAPRLAVGFTLN